MRQVSYKNFQQLKEAAIKSGQKVIEETRVSFYFRVFDKKSELHIFFKPL